MRKKVQEIMAGDKIRDPLGSNELVTVVESFPVDKSDIQVLAWDANGGRRMGDTFKYNTLMTVQGPTTKVLLVDQFSSITPCGLQDHPMRFDTLVEQLMAPETQERWRACFAHVPQLLEVEDDYRMPMASTMIRARADGFAEVWKMKWDSSG